MLYGETRLFLVLCPVFYSTLYLSWARAKFAGTSRQRAHFSYKTKQALERNCIGRISNPEPWNIFLGLGLVECES